MTKKEKDLQKENEALRKEIQDLKEEEIRAEKEIIHLHEEKIQDWKTKVKKYNKKLHEQEWKDVKVFCPFDPLLWELELYPTASLKKMLQYEDFYKWPATPRKELIKVLATGVTSKVKGRFKSYFPDSSVPHSCVPDEQYNTEKNLYNELLYPVLRYEIVIILKDRFREYFPFCEYDELADTYEELDEVLESGEWRPKPMPEDPLELANELLAEERLNPPFKTDKVVVEALNEPPGDLTYQQRNDIYAEMCKITGNKDPREKPIPGFPPNPETKKG